MSVINQMLQDLDRRNAMASADGPVPPQQLRAVSHTGSGHEWFWRTLALLAAIAVGWVGWVAYQIQPRPLATELALNSGEEARRKAPTPSAPRPAPPAPVIVAAPPVLPAAPQEAPSPRADIQSGPAPELFKLALAIEQPIPARPRVLAKAPARTAPAKTAGSIQVNKKDLPRSPAEEAENQFRHGVMQLNRGRTSEAQEDFAAALAKDPSHEPSRQALIAILIERRQLPEAQHLLEDGLAANPAQVPFATVLARIHVERGDYEAAARVLAASQNSAANDADFQLLNGAVLQRLGRHGEALAAFQRASKIAEQPGTTWVAMGISLEAVGRKSDALQAYRRSLVAGITAQDVRTFAESRIRALN